MLTRLKNYSELHPLRFVLLIAFVPRLVAAIFSKGYGMHDDHFLVIEAAQSWVDGYDYNAWLPWTEGNQGPSGHSLFYVGLHFIFFKILKTFGFTNPQFNMFLVRFIHALFSLTIIYYGFKITERIGNSKIATNTALILGLLWFMPMLSVRNLVEVVCVPFLLMGTWLLLKNQDEQKINTYFTAGLISGLAFSIRFQTLFFLGGMGLSLLISKQIRGSFIFGLGLILSILTIQSVPDYFLWKRPFAEFTEYVRYNIENATTYFNKPWYLYLLLLSGILLPPFSLFVLWGFFKNFRKHIILFLPSFCFLAFHSYFPNKQERFIFPIVPFLIILGYCGWEIFRQQSAFWIRNNKLYKILINFCLIINFMALPVVTTAYSKKSRVEAMSFLRTKEPVKALIVNDANHANATLSPRYYLGQWKFPEYAITSENTPEMLAHYFKRDTNAIYPNYVLFYEEENFEHRLNEMKKYFPGLQFMTKIEPSFLDNLLYKLNKHNKNAVCYIYKIN